jgi:hypothetical protein
MSHSFAMKWIKNSNFTEHLHKRRINDEKKWGKSVYIMESYVATNSENVKKFMLLFYITYQQTSNSTYAPTTEWNTWFGKYTLSIF